MNRIYFNSAERYQLQKQKQNERRRLQSRLRREELQTKFAGETKKANKISRLAEVLTTKV